jgi:enterochelin esterase-like enzyme
MTRARVGIATLVAVSISLSPAGAQGRVVHDTLHSRALVGNPLGDSPDREVLVYLPPSYDRSPSRRFPVLYLLHGATSKPIEWLDGSYQGFNLAKAMDSLATTDQREYIVVMPDADNSLGGSFYMNSGVGGRWEDAIAGELVTHIDARYRTIARRESRGLAGHSMGGFGVLFLAPRHADVFGAAYAMSACCLGFMGSLAPNAVRWTRNARAMADTTRRGSRAPVWRGDALTAAMVPPTSRPPFAGWVGYLPFVPSGVSLAPDSSVLATWRDRLPLERVERDRAALSRLRALALDVGRADSGVVPGVRAYASELRRVGLRHDLAEYDGDHINRVRERFERSVLPFFARQLDGTSR